MSIYINVICPKTIINIDYKLICNFCMVHDYIDNASGGIRGRILVQVTIYRGLLIGRDGPAEPEQCARSDD